MLMKKTSLTLLSCIVIFSLFIVPISASTSTDVLIVESIWNDVPSAYVDTFIKALNDMSLPFTTLSPLSVTPDILSDYDLVIIPALGPFIPANDLAIWDQVEFAEMVEDYVENGGALLYCPDHAEYWGYEVRDPPIFGITWVPPHHNGVNFKVTDDNHPILQGPYISLSQGQELYVHEGDTITLPVGTHSIGDWIDTTTGTTLTSGIDTYNYGKGRSVIVSTTLGWLTTGIASGTGVDGNTWKLFTQNMIHWLTSPENTYGGVLDDYAQDVIVENGEYIVTGLTHSFNNLGGGDVFLQKFTDGAVPQWDPINLYGGSSYDRGYCVQSTSDGYIIAGRTQSFGKGDQAYLVKAYKNGTQQWAEPYGDSSYDCAKSVTLSYDEHGVHNGYTIAAETYSTINVIQTNLTGGIEWEVPFDRESGIESCESIIHTSDGYSVIAGKTNSVGQGSYDILLLKYDSSGNIIWEDGILWGQSGLDNAREVIETSDGGYLVAGETNSYGNGLQILLMKFTSDGIEDWSQPILWGGPGTEEGHSVIEVSDGYIVTGFTNSYGQGGYDVCVIKYSKTGELLWEEIHGSAGDDYAKSIQELSSRKYIIAGYTNSYGQGGYDLYLLTVEDTELQGSVNAAFEYTPIEPLEGEVIRFTDLSSSDSNVIVSWTWDFGGVDTSLEQNPSFTFMESGEWSVSLTVVDQNGNTDTVTTIITIIANVPYYSEMVVYAEESVYFKQGSKVNSGSVAVNLRDSSTEALVGINVEFVEGTKLIADSIKTKKGSSLWDVEYNDIVLGENSVINGVITTPATLPVSDYPDFPTITPGTTDVTVLRGDYAEIYPGQYNEIQVKKNGVLVLHEGLYEVNRFNIGEQTEILCLGPTEIRVNTRMNIDKGSYFGPHTSSTTASASNLHFYVAGVDTSIKACKIGLSTIFYGNVYAPNGTVYIRQNAVATGAFFGKHAIIGYYVEINLENGF